MSRIVSKTIYQFDELSDRAKERARDWFRQHVFSDSNDWEHVYSDAEEMGKIIGIEIGQRSFETRGGGTGYEPKIYFSGFSSQGDGACFDGGYRYKKGALKAIKQAAPNDTELHRIAKALQEHQSRHFYQLVAKCKHSGHYYHSGCMDVEVHHYEDRYRDLGPTEGCVIQLMRDFADWIYKQLNNEYDYQNSDEQVDESIRANEYEFDEDGKRS